MSPAAGIVTETIADAGELLTAGAPLCVVTQLADAWLTIYVGEPDLGRVTLGQEVEVRTDDGQVRRGRVTFIASQAEFTPRNVQTRDERVKLVYRVKVGLENADGSANSGSSSSFSLSITPLMTRWDFTTSTWLSTALFASTICVSSGLFAPKLRPSIRISVDAV